MGTIDDEIQAIEDEILNTQKNKATEHHIGKLKAKLARLREEKEKRRKSSGRAGYGFDVKKTGHASIGLVGLPSVGKSTLLNALTGAESEIGAYHFTTLTVIPGVLEFKGAKIQVLDMPGIIRGAAGGKGRGREIIAVARNVDLILLLIDATQPDTLRVVVRELEDAGLRLNEKPADVVITPRDRGGLDVQFTCEQPHIDEEYVEDLAAEFKIVNAGIVVRDPVTPDQVVDAFAGNRRYVPAILAFNKIDHLDDATADQLIREHERAGWHTIGVSATEGRGIDEVKTAIFDALGFIRLYMRPQGGDPDYDEPLVLKSGSTIGEVCDALHRDFRRRFRYAQVWGDSAKFAGQRVGLEHELADEDVVTLILKK